VDVFDLDASIIKDYERFARSFTQIRAEDIRSQVDALYATGRFWPEPLISINPHYERGANIQDLVAEQSLHPDTARVFRIDGEPITLYRHQAQAISKATAGHSFVVTTGTGSGKSLCFFVPIIDAAIRARSAGRQPRTRAIISYPMNALANSQLQELEKFVEQSGLSDGLRPTFARYTGQESDEERELIKESKPDILLTNFMMLELLMTRQNERDRMVMSNAEGLDFLVLDELHTYRGRQGADVAMLVRRVRDRLCGQKAPICIGTSATMASEGEESARASAVARVASRLFGTSVSPDSVIDESLERATDPKVRISPATLAGAVDADLPTALDDERFRRHPLAIWIELEIISTAFLPKAPAPLIGVFFAVVIAGGLGLHQKEVGRLPLEIPHFAGFSWTPADVFHVIPAALGLAFVSAANILITSRVVEHFRGRHEHLKRSDADAELGAYGVANMVAGVFGAPMSAGIPARSLASVRCGGTTRMSNIFHAVFILAFLALGADYISHIPVPALAGVTAYIGICLLEWGTWRRLPKMSRVNALAFLSTATAVLIVNAVFAVGIGCSFYLFRYLYYRLSQARDA
jgi:hypothetical protein